MANGGLVLQKTKCPECNTPIPLPEVIDEKGVKLFFSILFTLNSLLAVD
jgi:hypothetical protein